MVASARTSLLGLAASLAALSISPSVAAQNPSPAAMPPPVGYSPFPPPPQPMSGVLPPMMPPPPGYFMPGYGPPPPPATKPKNIGLMTVGIVLSGISSMLVITGGMTLLAGAQIGCSVSCEIGKSGLTMMLIGGAGLAVGLPLVYIGSRRVPLEPDPVLGALRPEPRLSFVVGPQQIGLSGSF